MQIYPRLPVLGWAAFSGERSAPCGGMLSSRHRRYTTSGRAAIALALRELGIGEGSKVLVPTYHCPTMIAPVVRLGAQPVFYPITASGSVDVEWLERASLAGVRGLLATHYFGIPQSMAMLRAFCDARGIALIEDCAHAFFGELDGVAVGSIGDIAIASLPKFFPVPEGGVVASNARSLERLELEPCSWRDEIKAAASALEFGALYGRLPGLNSLMRGAFGLKKRLRGGAAVRSGAAGATPAGLSVDARLDALRPVISARWIASTVSRARIVGNRRRNYARLSERLRQVRGARALFPDLPEGAAPYVFPLYVEDPEASYQRLRSEGVPIFRWDEIWPGTPALEDDRGLDWANRVFQLGCHQDLSLSDIETMAGTVRASIEA